jgi:curli production assembly/transport component CsgF
MRVAIALFGGIVGALVLVSAASASQLTYAPINPTFGGNPLNGTYILSTAQAQGFGKAASASSSPNLSGLDAALSNLGNNLGSMSSPIIVIPTPTSTIPTNP